ncbi:hypothetical protein A8C32_05510 [Flavivirga aquatica]|uniref:DUF2975 domain-containing protein n=1 Tax=Flavivirga aquatica TaxID=1849968 RepID=A0A1E5SHP7_9FLAO|nr:hypothetical protein [Flavivirga aquatica]OEJ98657.1 hypothetical protein A8C32_05510 [Flavivirga aquatica]
MKKIKLLYRFLILINTLLIILLITCLIILVIPDFMYSKAYDDKVFGMFNHFIIFMRGIILFIGLAQVQRGLKAVIKQGFFNATSEVKFRKGGLFIIIFGVLGAIYNTCVRAELKLDIFINNYIHYFFIILVGLGLYMLVDFIKNGGKLKEENDLTI